MFTRAGKNVHFLFYFLLLKCELADYDAKALPGNDYLPFQTSQVIPFPGDDCPSQSISIIFLALLSLYEKCGRFTDFHPRNPGLESPVPATWNILSPRTKINFQEIHVWILVQHKFVAVLCEIFLQKAMHIKFPFKWMWLCLFLIIMTTYACNFL